MSERRRNRQTVPVPNRIQRGQSSLTVATTPLSSDHHAQMRQLRGRFVQEVRLHLCQYRHCHFWSHLAQVHPLIETTEQNV